MICGKCNKKISPWIVTTPDGVSLDIGSKCMSCGYESLYKPSVIIEAYDNATNKDIDWWFDYLLRAIEVAIMIQQNQIITNTSWSALSLYLKPILAIQLGREKYGKSDPQQIDCEWTAPDTLIEAVGIKNDHIQWQLRPKQYQGGLMRRIVGYLFAGY